MSADNQTKQVAAIFDELLLAYGVDPKYPNTLKDHAAKSVDQLLAQAEARGQIKVLRSLPRPDGTLTTTAYGLLVDYEISQQIAELEASLKEMEKEG